MLLGLPEEVGKVSKKKVKSAKPDSAIDQRNFKQGYFKALEWVLSDTGIKQN